MLYHNRADKKLFPKLLLLLLIISIGAIITCNKNKAS
jgi:hypothetical protein